MISRQLHQRTLSFFPATSSRFKRNNNLLFHKQVFTRICIGVRVARRVTYPSSLSEVLGSIPRRDTSFSSVNSWNLQSRDSYWRETWTRDLWQWRWTCYPPLRLPTAPGERQRTCYTPPVRLTTTPGERQRTWKLHWLLSTRWLRLYSFLEC